MEQSNPYRYRKYSVLKAYWMFHGEYLYGYGLFENACMATEEPNMHINGHGRD
jgi:hypothetical protein